MLSVVLSEFMKLVFQDYIIDCAVSKEHRVFDAVFVPKRRLQDMKTWRYSGASCKVTDLSFLYLGLFFIKKLPKPRY